MRQNLTNVGKVDIDAVDHFYIVGCTHRDGLLGFDNYKIDLKNYTKQPPPPPDFNGHDYVDLGLPSGTLWATEDVRGDGAGSRFREAYFSWGETANKTSYTINTYFDTSDGGSTYNKYALDKKTALEPEDDAAHVIWGGDWLIPTLAQWQELYENCTQHFDVYDRTLTFQSIKFPDRSINLYPLGYYENSKNTGNGTRGYYWASELANTINARMTQIYTTATIGSSMSRFRGAAIRAVISPKV